MAPRAIPSREDAFSGQHAERARESACICSGFLRKFFCASRRFPQGIGDAEFCDGMKTPWETMTHRNS
jgi:hypothetical protein